MIWVGFIGVKGYLGETLSRLVAGHPEAQVSTVTDLQGIYNKEFYMCGSNEVNQEYWKMMNAIEKSDIIYNGLSGAIAEDLSSRALSYGKRMIDISDENHMRGSLKGSFGSVQPGSVYGLSELYKDKMRGAAIAVNPSSYCTGAILGLVPLAVNNISDMDSVAVESKSGIASLGRNDKLTETGMTANGGIKVYKTECAEYAKEVNEQMLTLFGRGTSASYQAYIIPGIRGITTTIKLNHKEGMNVSDVLNVYKNFYKNNSFIEVCDSGLMSGLRNGLKKCFCKIKASADLDSGIITVTTVLDDAIRGVAGQAIQTMNLMFGIDGETGL